MDFLGQDKQVLCCSNKVASALTSVSNWFLLTIGLDLSSLDPQELIEYYMQRCISKHILELYKKFPANPENVDSVRSLWGVTKSLLTGIDLNPVAGSMNEFKPTKEYQFFDILKIPLFHASDFNEQVSSVLSSQMEKNAVGILYVNKEFRTVFEHNGKVYTLIQERNLHRSKPEAHWTTVVGQRERFVSSDFSFLPAGINEMLHDCSSMGCLGSFCSKINYRRHCGTHDLASSSDLIYTWSDLGEYWDQVSVEKAFCILSDGDKAVKEAHGISVDEMLRCFVSDPEFRSTSKELRSTVKKINDFKKAAKPSSADLLDVLTTASEGTSISTNLLEVTMPYVEVDIHDHKIRSMLACYSFSVEQSLAKRYISKKKAVQRYAAIKELLMEVAAIKELLMEEEAEKSSLKELSKDYGSAQDFDHKDDASNGSTKSESDEVQVSDDNEVFEDVNRKLLPSDISHLPRLHGDPGHDET